MKIEMSLEIQEQNRQLQDSSFPQNAKLLLLVAVAVSLRV